MKPKLSGAGFTLNPSVAMLPTPSPSLILSLALLLVAAVASPGFAAPVPELTVTKGPVSNQVLQRGPDGTATVQLFGTVAGAEGKSVEARLLRKGLPVQNFAWKSIGRVTGANWNGEIKAVPTGGPYRVELRLTGQEATVAIDNVLVGDLWILAGQSNMQGVGNLVNVTPPHELIHSFEFNESWRIAKEPLHNYGDAIDPVHWKLSPMNRTRPMDAEELATYARRTTGAGPGLPFAATMVERTGVPIGLLPCAQGGSSMNQWNPADADKGGESLYGSMLRRFRAVGGRVAGVLWYQGESEASPTANAALETKFPELVAAIRRDFGQPNLPFYYVQIGRFVNRSNEADWNRVQAVQLQTEPKIAPGAMAASVDLALDDVIHLDTASQKRLGVRLANLVCHDLFPALPKFQSVKRGPRPVAAMMQGNSVRVSFDEVNGSLQAGGRVAGFSIHNAAGEALPVIVKTEFTADGKGVILTLNPYNLPEQKFLTEMTLRYGYGKDPYCNVTDSLDMALPAFGPLPIQGPVK